MPDTSRNKSSLVPKLALSAASLLFCFALLGLGELYCRYFMDINLRKTSRDFAVVGDQGRVIGNAKNAAGVSFGVDVFSDENGFRIPPGYTNTPKTSAVLFLGDSVAFGVGVPEERTFVGLLRKQKPDINVHNSAFPGASVEDYKRVMDDFFPRHPEVDRVYLVYCLNDFQPRPAVAASEDPGLWKRTKRWIASLPADVNEFLGPRSKLFVYITGKTADPSRRYFRWDLTLYNVDDQVLAETLQPIVDIDRMAKARNSRFTVVINPYEMQVRDGANANFEPQRRVEAFLAANGVDVLDTRDAFKGLAASKDAFLFADPMHLNEKGHQIVFDELVKDR